MSLAFRHRLPWLVALAWLVGSWWLLLGAPPAEQLFSWDLWDGVRARYSELHAAAWFAGLMAAMFGADWLLCRYADWRYGIDPMKVHWSRLRNRDGFFLCANCLSPFMLPPEDGRDEGWVHCGDCGHAVAPYGEMKPYFPDMIGRHVGPFKRMLRGR